ncbi:AtpZ/AtpI family protein [Tenacibaculum agarivorans]|uniref:AtpZ/AtpI family protein n=1 Tax=Tenacibaculum agarivorans TaxID=1908389 RepID=UPI00094B8BBA|nr:AtpZ/AtpI family protein [Tenacibaculum agarivorans]
MSKRENKNQYHKYIRFSGIAIQMGGTIYLGSLLGKWLDGKYPNSDEIYTKVCTLAAVFMAMYAVIKQVSNISKDND